MAMTSGSKVVTRLVNSGQLFLTRRRRLLAFHVINFNGSFFFFTSASPSFSFSLGFFADPSESFSTTLKNRFILLPSFFTLRCHHSSLTLFASTVKFLPFVPSFLQKLTHHITLINIFQK